MSDVEQLVQVLVDDAWLGHDELTMEDLWAIAEALLSAGYVSPEAHAAAIAEAKAEALREAARAWSTAVPDNAVADDLVHCSRVTGEDIAVVWLRSRADRIEAHDAQ